MILKCIALLLLLPYAIKLTMPCAFPPYAFVSLEQSDTCDPAAVAGILLSHRLPVYAFVSSPLLLLLLQV
jgi:hypothetical protein